MILHTFSIFDGIGIKTERRLWEEGILTWADLMDMDMGEVPFCSSRRLDIMRESVCYLSEELRRSNPEPFASYLRQRDHWRLFERFRDGVACLDIETNGLPQGRGGKVTVVGIYRNDEYIPLVKDENLSEESITDALKGVKLLVTFFGAGFDIPFLRRVYPGVDLRIPHFDLSFGARRLGIRGGLKKIETMFGLSRSEGIEGLNGYDAVLLWRSWRRGQSSALERLIEYNRADTVNLFLIAERLYSLLREETGIERFLGNGRPTQ